MVNFVTKKIVVKKKFVIFFLFLILLSTGAPWIIGRYILPDFFETSRYIIKFHIATAIIFAYVLSYSPKHLLSFYSIPLVGVLGIAILLLPKLYFTKDIIIILHAIYGFFVFTILSLKVFSKKSDLN